MRVGGGCKLSGEVGASTVRLLSLVLFGLMLAVSGGHAAVERVVPQNAVELQLSYAAIVKQAAPAVVNVYATKITQQNVSPFSNDPFFQRFFGRSSPFFQSRPRESQSLGSGVIIDPSGVVLSNSHVVSGADNIRIALSNGREYDVDLVLDDPKTDLAVLRIKKPDQDFTFLEFGDSDALEVGDLVLAIGNPFGVGQTVTSGIISALGRTGIETSDYGFFIQTDAAINPGNSGGALVDMSGRLVGVNSAIFTRSGGSLGIGFAIPANMARVVADAGVHNRAIDRPWMGVALQDVNSDLADSLGIDPPYGALITEVADDSPAQLAGLQSGDVILSIDDVKIENTGAFSFRMATKPAVGTTKVEFTRNRQIRRVDVALSPRLENSGGEVTISGDSRFSGASARDLTPQLAESLGLPFSATGVVIIDVRRNSPAAALGLLPGDVIFSLNGAEIQNAESFLDRASTRQNSWEIVMQRDGRTLRYVVRG